MIMTLSDNLLPVVMVGALPSVAVGGAGCSSEGAYCSVSCRAQVVTVGGTRSEVIGALMKRLGSKAAARPNTRAVPAMAVEPRLPILLRSRGHQAGEAPVCCQAGMAAATNSGRVFMSPQHLIWCFRFAMKKTRSSDFGYHTVFCSAPLLQRSTSTESPA